MRLAGRVAFQIWIVLFIVFFGAETVHIEPGLRVATQVLYGVPLAAWIALRLRGPFDRLDWGVLTLLGIYAIACVSSRDRTESLGTLGLATAFAGLFLVLRRERQTGVGDQIISAVAIGMAVTLTYNAWLLVDEKLRWIDRFGAAPFEGVTVFPWQSVNAMPVVVLLAAPALAWHPPGLGRTVALVAVAISSVIVVPLSLGRAGWLGIAVAALVYAGASVTAPRQWLTRRRAAIAGIVAIVAAIGLAPRVVQALAETGRLLIWGQGGSMALDRPILGSGPGTHSWARLAYAPAEANQLAVPLIHNTALQTLVDGGVVLLIAVAVVLCMWASAVRLQRSARGDRLALAVLVGWAASTTLDDFSYLPALTAVVLLTAAFVAPVAAVAQRPAAPSRPWVGLAPVAALTAAALVALPSVIAVDVARSASQEARTAMVDGRYQQAAALFRAAVNRHPEHGGAWLGLGMALAYAGDEDAARRAYQTAIAASPGDARGYGGAAALARSDERLQLLARAAALTGGDPQYAVRYGEALAEAGRLDEAAAAWAEAVTLDPRLLQRLTYSSTEIDAERVERQAAASVANGPRAGASENDMLRWDFELATGSLSTSAGLAWQAVDLARRGDLDRAAEAADLAVQQAPYDARGHQAAAAVAAFRCDRQAERDARAGEAHARGAFVTPTAEPGIAREFVYREVGLGATQPPGVGTGVTPERWPWSLVDRPACS